MHIWISADEHFSHGNILKYCNRSGFMNSEEIAIIQSGKNSEIRKLKISKESILKMNSEIIRRHNERVKKNDTVIHNGDFCFYSANLEGNGLILKPKHYIEQLNGNHIFVEGNHDKKNRLNTHIRALILNIGGINIYVVHNPLYAKPEYPINLVGHVHNSWDVLLFGDYYKRKKAELGKDLPQKYLKTVQTYVNKWRGVKKDSILINVGVDVRKFAPMSFDEIFKVYYQRRKNGQ